ncbi:hypothetical protein [Flavobacterium johnsoniae]|jgi:phosphoenolpyruvate carboxylase|uniref:Uncharacterized protein n=1 Tax=Flavobacterium johnsoniae TaxID=986 RepID=A0A1M5S6G0_FLAJO|nr:hypothetical protein [Flavobacterium johnsoniae]SHH34094.1 hypothetical protein SAMN05444388_109139 [Flavobacterium johnsoniae]
MNSINLGTKHHQILQAEFKDVSRQTIHSALRYFSNSATAKAIRKRAKELLEEELKQIKEDV